MRVDQLQSTPASSKLDRDALAMVSREAASEAAFVILDQIGKYRPEVAIAGVAVAFAAFASRVNMEPRELAAIGQKVLDTETPHGRSMGSARLEAIQDYAKLKFRSDRKGIR